MSIEFGDMRTAYGNALIELGEENKNIVVLGADTTDSLKTSGCGSKRTPFQLSLLINLWMGSWVMPSLAPICTTVKFPGLDVEY